MTLTYGHALLRVRLPALELQNLIMSMFLMVMAYLREDWGCTMERNTWMQPQFRFLQEIQSAKYKFYRITVLIFYAVHLLTLCILEKLQEIWELIQSSFLYAQAFLALNLGQNTCVRSWRQF